MATTTTTTTTTILCGACHERHADSAEACPDYPRWLAAAPQAPRNGDYEGAILAAQEADSSWWG